MTDTPASGVAAGGASVGNRRWALLREALLQAATSKGKSHGASSTRTRPRQPTFAMLPRTECDWVPTHWVDLPQGSSLTAQDVWAAICDSLQVYDCNSLIVICGAAGERERQVWTALCHSLCSSHSPQVTLQPPPAATPPAAPSPPAATPATPPPPPPAPPAAANPSLHVQRQHRSSTADAWCLATYTVPRGGGLSPPLQLLARERRSAAPTSLSALFSHKVHGVDNTGNVRVWDAEGALLRHLLLSTTAVPPAPRVLELGGGMTALAGIGVAAAVSGASVVVTDGHPDALEGQRVCARLNAHACSAAGSRVLAAKLLWSAGSAAADVAALAAGDGGSSSGCPSDASAGATGISSGVGGDGGGGGGDSGGGSGSAGNVDDDGACVGSTAGVASAAASGAGHFDVVIGADCLFFENFHADLLEVLRCALAPRGAAYLLQPLRGGSLERFVAKAQHVLQVEVRRRWDEQVWERHLQLQQAATAEAEAAGEGGGGGEYREDSCYPVLVVLRHRALTDGS